MKVIHINAANDPLRKQGNTYPREFWGHVVTNKAIRNNKTFAYKVESRGRWKSPLSHEDFQWFKNHCEHETIEDHVQVIVDRARALVNSREYYHQVPKNIISLMVAARESNAEDYLKAVQRIVQRDW